MEAYIISEIRGEETTPIEKYHTDFDTALEDDFNTPQCLTILFDLIKAGNKLIDENKLENPTDVLKFLEASVAVLGLKWTEKEAIPEHIQKLAADRETARKEKDFARSDELRKQIENEGFLIEDTSSGVKLRRK